MPQRPLPRDGAPPRMPTAKRLALELPILLLLGLTLVLVVAVAWALVWKGSDSDAVAAAMPEDETAGNETPSAAVPVVAAPAVAAPAVAVPAIVVPAVAASPPRPLPVAAPPAVAPVVPPPTTEPHRPKPALEAERTLREFQQACRALDDEIEAFLTRLEASRTADEMAELRVWRRVYGAASFLDELVSWQASPGRQKPLAAEDEQELGRLIQRTRELEDWTVTFFSTQEG